MAAIQYRVASLGFLYLGTEVQYLRYRAALMAGNCREMILCTPYIHPQAMAHVSALYRGPILNLWQGDIVSSGIESSYRPVSQCSLAGRYDNPMPELIVSSLSGTKNFYVPETNIIYLTNCC